MSADKVTCRSPHSSREVRVVRWKFEAMREALQGVVPPDEKGVAVTRLAGLASDRIPLEQLQQMGNVVWLTEVVRLEVEVRGEVEAVPGSKPKRIRRAL